MQTIYEFGKYWQQCYIRNADWPLPSKQPILSHVWKVSQEHFDCALGHFEQAHDIRSSRFAEISAREKKDTCVWYMGQHNSPQSFHITTNKGQHILRLPCKHNISLTYSIKKRWCMRQIPTDAQLQVVFVNAVVHGSWKIEFKQTRATYHVKDMMVWLAGQVHESVEQLPIHHSITIVHVGNAKDLLQDMNSLQHILHTIWSYAPMAY